MSYSGYLRKAFYKGIIEAGLILKRFDENQVHFFENLSHQGHLGGKFWHSFYSIEYVRFLINQPILRETDQFFQEVLNSRDNYWINQISPLQKEKNLFRENMFDIPSTNDNEIEEDYTFIGASIFCLCPNSAPKIEERMKKFFKILDSNQIGYKVFRIERAITEYGQMTMKHLESIRNDSCHTTYFF
jgi:hypothetical protein